MTFLDDPGDRGPGGLAVGRLLVLFLFFSAAFPPSVLAQFSSNNGRLDIIGPAIPDHQHCGGCSPSNPNWASCGTFWVLSAQTLNRNGSQSCSSAMSGNLRVVGWVDEITHAPAPFSARSLPVRFC